jgi:hypothetical protein
MVALGVPYRDAWGLEPHTAMEFRDVLLEARENVASRFHDDLASRIAGYLRGGE